MMTALRIYELFICLCNVCKYLNKYKDKQVTVIHKYKRKAKMKLKNTPRQPRHKQTIHRVHRI